MFCNQCGYKNAENAKFCNKCGAELYTQDSKDTTDSTEGRQPPTEQKPKKMGKGCLIVLLVMVAILILSTALGIRGQVPPDEADSIASTEGKSEEVIADEFKAFDERTWEDFKTMYKAHNQFMDAIALYGEGKVSQLDFYNYCKQSEDYFRQASLSFGYHTNDDEKEYLSAFSSWATYDQLVAKNMMKYLDSGKTSDLSSAQENIKLATTAVEVISSNRALLLDKAGYTEEEKEEVINRSLEELKTE